MNDRAVATYIMAALCVIVALVGGAVVLLDQQELTFKDYADTLSVFAIGVGLLAVGRGINNAGRG